MTEVIDTSFKLINMTVLSSIFLYVFYKYILPLLKAEMVSDQAFSAAFENQKVLLSQEEELLKKNILEEMLEQKNLKQKLLFWNSSIDQVKLSANLSKQQLSDQIYERKVAIKKKQVQIQTEQATIHAAIIKAEEALKSFFANEKEGTDYIEKLIEQSSLKKGT